MLDIQRQLSSFVVDWVVRLKLTGLNLNFFVIAEAPLQKTIDQLARVVTASLSFTSPLFSPERLILNDFRPDIAFSEHERNRNKIILDAVALVGMGLNNADANHVLSGCDVTTDRSRLNPKGFWRVDKDKEPELRHTVLTLIAFHDLERKIQTANSELDRGIDAFFTQNNGEGWLLPESLCLADYGLGHDDRAKQPQLVASRLGPRFYDWQLAQTTDEARRECHLHARNLLGDLGYRQLVESISNPHLRDQKTENAPLPEVAEEPAIYNKDTPDSKRGKETGQSDMFK